MANNLSPIHPIRIAHVAAQLDIGGMEKLLVEFAKHADRQRFELRFVSLSSRGRLVDEIEACGWPVACLEEPPGFRLGLVLRLARLFRRCNIDIVHTHNTKPLIFAAPAARLARVPRVVHTRHGQRFRASSRQTALFPWLAAMTDRVVCVSKDSAELSAREGISEKRIKTILNGIDLSRFDYIGPQERGPALMVGRLSPEKDVETLVWAAALVVRERPPFRLRIAGDGPCLASLKQLAYNLGLQGKVEFLGEVRAIPGLLAQASLFVLPSLTEGVSLTLLEAMARGLPVVATHVGGNPEVVVNGETGYLVPTKSASELAAAILAVLRDPDHARLMGLAGRRRVEKYFDVRRMMAEYETLYLKLQGKRYDEASHFQTSISNHQPGSRENIDWLGSRGPSPIVRSEIH